MRLLHSRTISYLNPNFKSQDIIALISLWIGTIANSRAALQCSVEHAVIDEHPLTLLTLSSPFSSLVLSRIFPSRLLVPSSNPFSILLPPLNYIPFLPLLSSLLLLFHLFLSIIFCLFSLLSISLPFSYHLPLSLYSFSSHCLPYLFFTSSLWHLLFYLFSSFFPQKPILLLCHIFPPFSLLLALLLPFSLILFPFLSSLHPFHLAVLSLLFHCVYWGLYARDGVGNGSLKILGEFFSCISHWLTDWLKLPLHWKIPCCLSRMNQWTMMHVCAREKVQQLVWWACARP